VTVILLSGSYKGNEFVRIGYYVNNEYDDEELNNNPPPTPLLERIRRNILAEKPRVTRFAIKWYVCASPYSPRPYTPMKTIVNIKLTPPLSRDSEASAPAEFPPEQPEADLVADEDEYGAEELAEEEEAEKEEGVEADAKMDGVETAEGELEVENGVDDDELSEDGSVDIEGESEDELEEELEEEGEGAEMDVDMDVDMDKPAVPASGAKTEEAMVH